MVILKCYEFYERKKEIFIVIKGEIVVVFRRSKISEREMVFRNLVNEIL